jgi:hypothetical protein
MGDERLRHGGRGKRKGLWRQHALKYVGCTCVLQAQLLRLPGKRWAGRLDLQQPSFYFGHHLAVVSKGSMPYTNKLLVERKAHCTNKVSAADDVMQDLHLDTTESLLPSNTWLQHSVFRRLFVTSSYCQRPCRAKQV